MSTVGNSFRIPQFLLATSPSGLVQVMLRNNLKYGAEFRYFDIQFAQGKWVAWYNVEISKEGYMAEVLKVKK